MRTSISFYHQQNCVVLPRNTRNFRRRKNVFNNNAVLSRKLYLGSIFRKRPQFQQNLKDLTQTSPHLTYPLHVARHLRSDTLLFLGGASAFDFPKSINKIETLFIHSWVKIDKYKGIDKRTASLGLFLLQDPLQLCLEGQNLAIMNRCGEAMYQSLEK